MAYEIIFKCRSINNKNIREGELNILRKNENQLCFEFGENEMNIKKRFYKDLKTLNEDFSKLQKIKKQLEIKKNEPEVEPEIESEEEITDAELEKVAKFLETDAEEYKYRVNRKRKK